LIESNCEIVFVTEAGRLSIIQKLRNWPNDFLGGANCQSVVKGSTAHFFAWAKSLTLFFCELEKHAVQHTAQVVPRWKRWQK
jgi:hypothetical protein